MMGFCAGAIAAVFVISIVFCFYETKNIELD